MYEGCITDIEGIAAGHYTDARAKTGCTAVLCEQGAVCGVDVRGGAPGTRETDLMRPGNLVRQAHAVLLTGGSAFGLDAAGGVMQYLEERGVGFDTPFARVPIVPAAVIYDLDTGDAGVRPDKKAGFDAAAAASRSPLAQGAVGAGAGATTGKLMGPEHASRGGAGAASLRLENGLIVAALFVVNALGDVVDPYTGAIVSGLRGADGRFLDTVQCLLRGARAAGSGGQNTVIGVVATNASLDKEAANRMASAAHDGIARSVRPAHTMADGDTAFALATGGVEADIHVVLAAAAEVTARAIVNACTA